MGSKRMRSSPRRQRLRIPRGWILRGFVRDAQALHFQKGFFYIGPGLGRTGCDKYQYSFKSLKIIKTRRRWSTRCAVRVRSVTSGSRIVRSSLGSRSALVPYASHSRSRSPPITRSRKKCLNRRASSTPRKTIKYLWKANKHKTTYFSKFHWGCKGLFIRFHYLLMFNRFVGWKFKFLVENNELWLKHYYVW